MDINQILVDTLLLSHRQLEKNRIQVVRRLGTIPVTVADGGRLQQVFLELLINAQQALADGGTLTVSSTSDGGWIDIRIADDGPGIDPEHLPRIFEPFFTTKGALGGAKVPGTGLGLSTAYNIVRDHGGSLRVTSEPNRGACFIVTLPVRRLHETPRRESRPGRPRSLDRSGRMLVVDDDRTLRSLICELLHGLGHETREAEELDQAMGILEIWSADILIVDRMVPGMDDLRGYEQVRASYPELPILFIMSRSSTAGLESEGDPWMFRLNKPFRNRDLMALVTRILSQRLDRAS